MKPEIESLIKAATSQNVPNTLLEVEALEAAIGKVPDSLRRLMVRYGSFSFKNFMQVTGTLLGDLPISTFYSATNPYGILDDLDSFPDLRKNDLIPFADDEFDDRFAYSTRDQSVWFVDTTYELGIRQASPTIEQFLNSLCVDESI